MASEPHHKSGAGLLSVAIFLLGLGAGVGYAFAGYAPVEAGYMAAPAGAIVTAAGLLGFSLLWRSKAPAAVQPAASEDVALPAQTKEAAAPEPVRPPQAESELIKLEGPCIDEATLESLRTLGGDDFVKEIMSQFISEGVLTLFKVAQAVGECDSVEYGAQVHALRSSAANVGALRLYKLCLDWRELSQEQLATSGSARFVQLQREFSAAERALKERHDYTDRDVASIARAG